ncbi:MAG TPA: hypothetical protein PK258_03345 [Fervidobacterium sp.]|nr:hypothetical protein [Fervidobacterium sp.]HOL03808.1 hypothetical protein [Fervidobacterium sp.]HON04211.1 hypothetical protein [Fervidobacterium sp.]HPC79283.1 hypothetical protein [Fervidobacterium sp.]HRB91726.1 hypothetical protein [Fervidobacterium sp.]
MNVENVLTAVRVGLSGYVFLILTLVIFFGLVTLFVKLFAKGEDDGKENNE